MLMQAMERRYTALAEEQGKLASEKEKLVSENNRLTEVIASIRQDNLSVIEKS